MGCSVVDSLLLDRCTDSFRGRVYRHPRLAGIKQVQSRRPAWAGFMVRTDVHTGRRWANGHAILSLEFSSCTVETLNCCVGLLCVLRKIMQMRWLRLLRQMPLILFVLHGEIDRTKQKCVQYDLFVKKYAALRNSKISLS